ncbi:MAG: pyrroline-5-carboxylate reductase [Prevotella sp.]|nr:pyrroline-5-carboxylate reductase [Prevotella sp.]
MKISVIGAGAMGGSMVKGLLQSKSFRPEDITVADPSQQSLAAFENSGITLTTDNQKAAAAGDFVAVVVKPWLVQTVLEEIKSSMDYSRQLLIVIAARVSSENICQWLSKDDEPLLPLFLVIPNIAIAMKESVTFIVPVNTTEEQTEKVTKIFDELGESVITTEKQLSAGTALASCGIAYAMRYVRAAAEGGVELGFKADVAQRIVMQTIKGAVTLLQTSGMHPEQAIDLVTTPGGVTIRGLNAMEQSGFTNAVIQGLKASK